MARIIDASVAVKWFVIEAGREYALEILEEVLAKPAGFAVPELFYFELSHVLSRVAPNLSPEQEEVLECVLRLGWSRFAMTVELWEASRDFIRIGLSGYDAAYAGLAKLLKGTWLTFDRKAHAKLARTGVSG